MTLVPLGDTARFVNGAAFKPEDWGNDGLPIIRIQNLTGTGSEFNFTQRAVKSELLVDPGDLLVSWSATLDVYRWSGPQGVLNQHIFKVLPQPGVDADYLYFALKSALAELSRKTHGSTMKHVVRGDFESTLVRLTALTEQRRIVDLLTRAEGIVRLRREAQRKAAELIPAIFIDMFGDPATNPKGWPTAPLGELLAAPIRNGISPSRAGRYVGHVLTLSAITRGRFDVGAIKESTFAAPLAAHDAVSTDDFLICRGNGNPDLVGAGCFPTCDLPSVAFPDTAIAVRPDRTRLSRSYLSAYWKTNYARSAINRIAKTTNGTFKINQAGVAGLTIPLPPLDQQSAFAELAGRIESVEQQQGAALNTAQATFDALLAQAFSPAMLTTQAPAPA